MTSFLKKISFLSKTKISKKLTFRLQNPINILLFFDAFESFRFWKKFFSFVILLWQKFNLASKQTRNGFSREGRQTSSSELSSEFKRCHQITYHVSVVTRPRARSLTEPLNSPTELFDYLLMNTEKTRASVQIMTRWLIEFVDHSEACECSTFPLFWTLWEEPEPFLLEPGPTPEAFGLFLWLCRYESMGNQHLDGTLVYRGSQ